ncbi:hypothetical protein [Dactylosporangium sp. NPDC000521]
MSMSMSVTTTSPWILDRPAAVPAEITTGVARVTMAARATAPAEVVVHA